MVSPLIHYDDCYSPSECFGNANPFAGNLISSAQPVKVSFEGNGFEEDAAQRRESLFLYEIHSHVVSSHSLVCRFITSSNLDLAMILVFTRRNGIGKALSSK